MTEPAIGPATSLREVAFLVCDEIAKVGGTVVLSGGGAATIYTEDAYQSRDLDFVLSLWGQETRGWVTPLEVLGYVREGGIYVHRRNPFIVEFLPHPLAIDEEVITEWNTLRENGRRLHILTPTDCVRDRLAWFVYNDDYSGLEQGILVVANQRDQVDLAAIETWFRRENAETKHALFRDRLDRMTAQ